MEQTNKKRKERDTPQGTDDSSSIVRPKVTVGPQPPPPKKPKKKTPKPVLAFESLYLSKLPSAEMYEKSYMHRDVVTHTIVSKRDYIITASRDGHIKFWKKKPVGIEFVKHFRAHLSPIIGLSVTHDGAFLCTSSSEDKTLKIFDVTSFDMINMIELPFEPGTCEWIYHKITGKNIIAVADKSSPKIYLYDINPPVVLNHAAPLEILEDLHHNPVILIKFNYVYGIVISIDTSGNIEYWDALNDHQWPKENVLFQLKTESDLYKFLIEKTYPTSLDISPEGSKFATMGKDRQVRIFDFLTGKLLKKYDESLHVFNERQKSGNPEDMMYRLDAIDFGRRFAVDKTLDANDDLPVSNVIFDESGNFVLYPTMCGIKLVNLVTDNVRLIGRVENTERFLGLSLYQGKTKGSVETGDLKINADYDPTLVCCAFKKNRFYLFTKREPEDTDPNDLTTGRDVFNERPSKEEQTVAPKGTGAVKLGRDAVIHTTMGDIFVKLYPEETPKACENFVTHSKNGYYNGLIFHRVIKGFMIQTGDPLGDGTGGTSIWGSDFEDEFHPKLTHNKPFVLSMANRGPNTNGSQFFITTAAMSRLDGKYTLFGKVVKGADVAMEIEKVRTDKMDKPYEDVKIVNIQIL